MREREVKSYKWRDLKNCPPKNAVIYVLNVQKGGVEAFITDDLGNPIPLLGKDSTQGLNIRDYVEIGPDNIVNVRNNKIYVKKMYPGDDFITIEETNNKYVIKLNEDKLELVENKQNNLNIDGTGTKYPTVDAVNEALDEIRGQFFEPIKHYFSNSTEEIVEHNLGRYPSVVVLEGTQVIIPNSIEHTPDMNTVIVTFIPETTGVIIIE